MQWKENQEKTTREKQEDKVLNEKIRSLFLRFDHVLSEIEFDKREPEERHYHEYC